MQIPFQKKFKTLEEIVALLKERGLIFDDESLAIISERSMTTHTLQHGCWWKSCQWVC